MTALACAPLEWRRQNTTPRDKVDPVELAVEEILALRHDVDDHALALTLLRGIRPDLPALAIEAAVLDLLDHARETRDAEIHGPHSVFEAAAERYEIALHRFAHGGRS